MTRKPCCRAVWKESDQEEDGVVPSNWIAGKYIWWPSNEKGKKKTAIYEQKDPDKERWDIFDLLKIKLHLVRFNLD